MNAIDEVVKRLARSGSVKSIPSPTPNIREFQWTSFENSGQGTVIMNENAVQSLYNRILQDRPSEAFGPGTSHEEAAWHLLLTQILEDIETSPSRTSSIVA